MIFPVWVGDYQEGTLRHFLMRLLFDQCVWHRSDSLFRMAWEFGRGWEYDVSFSYVYAYCLWGNLFWDCHGLIHLYPPQYSPARPFVTVLCAQSQFDGRLSHLSDDLNSAAHGDFFGSSPSSAAQHPMDYCGLFGICYGERDVVFVGADQICQFLTVLSWRVSI